MVSLSDLDFLHQTLASLSTTERDTLVTRSADNSREQVINGEPEIRAPNPSNGSTPTPSLASLLATLQAATSRATVPLNSTEATEEEPMSDADLEKMLERLNEAEGAADDLEGRLDGLLGNLDSMLSLLGVDPGELDEDEGTAEAQEEAGEEVELVPSKEVGEDSEERETTSTADSKNTTR